MKISRYWLQDFVDIAGYSDAEIASLMTFLGAEVESIEYPDDFSQVIVGLVRECKNISNSKNRLCFIDIGGQNLQIVCGALNVRSGMLVSVVLPGGNLPEGKPIESTLISGFESTGMICSQFELKLGGTADIIWDLESESELKGRIELGADLRKLFQRDTVFNLEITHNRSDLLSHYGVARDLAGKLSLKLDYPSCAVSEEIIPAEKFLKVDILSPDRCPRYCGRIVKDIKVKPAPRWMQRRLLAVGLRPISNVVDVTNYVLMELGHPLHAFDLNFIENRQIIVKNARNGEKFTTLDEKEHTLTSEDLLICDAKKGVALAGVMGGLNSEITDNTQDVLLECAYFAPVGIRRTSKRHNIVSDSSHRFERGVDPNAVPQVIDRTARLIRETAGGEILRGRVDNYAKKITPVKIDLRPARVNFVLGSRMKKERMVNCLRNIGFEVSASGKELKVKVPTFRPDVAEEIDLVEEIARIDGFEKVGIAPRSLVSLEVTTLAEEDLDDFIREKLVAEGMQEVISHSMRHHSRPGLEKGIPVAIRNPLSADFAVMRYDLYAPLLEIAEHNLNNGARTVKIFELGHIFRRKDGGSIWEKKQLAGLMTGIAEEVFWGNTEKEADFYHFKGIVENFVSNLAFENASLQPLPAELEAIFDYGQAVKVGEAKIGEFGKLRDEIAERFDIKGAVFLFGFDYPQLLDKYNPIKKYHPFSRFPAVKRDLSIIVEESVSALELENIVRAKGGELLQNLEFFDLYRGKQLPAGKKSLSLSFRFASAERTLTDEEVDAQISAIVKGIEANGGELRKM
jgi:phenylalanyl-tRNA synthetase beta chain